MGFFSSKTKLVPDIDSELSSHKSVLAAIDRSMAVIEFTVEGQILTANANFLAMAGYRLDEIEGKHHRILCYPDTVNSREYQQFWNEIASGQYKSGEVRRKNKAGEEVWLEATYNPIKDESGKVVKVIKFASDITNTVQTAKQHEDLITALNNSVAVIEFMPDGTIIKANKNFCSTTGHPLENLEGQHHRIFCKDDYAASPAYKTFWSKLANGEHYSGQIERINSVGDTLWLEATYNPIFNSNGQVYKVVKLASDITERVSMQLDNAKSAAKAHKLAQGADTFTDQGAVVIHEAASEMSQISTAVGESAEIIDQLADHSKEITNIVNTIGSIAEQTNLLALNAAIEAARAGDQGRGFAVVADEVRQLAGRTSESTQEISTMIDKIQVISDSARGSMGSCKSQADTGAGLASEAGEVITKIQSSLTEVVNAVSIFAENLEEENNDQLK